MPFLNISLVFTDRFLAMHVTLSPYLVAICLPLSSLGSNDTDRSATGATVERVSTSLPIYEDTKLIVGKEIKLKWKEVNDAFVGTFWEDLEDCQVYVKIHKSGLYQIACRYPVFACIEMIHYIVSHSYRETMTLSSVTRTEISTIRA